MPVLSFGCDEHGHICKGKERVACFERRRIRSLLSKMTFHERKAWRIAARIEREVQP